MTDFECPECGREFSVRGFHSHWGHTHDGPVPDECPEPEFSKEHRENISKANEGREVSEETRQKISEAGKERFKDPKEREKAAEARRGISMPEDAKRKISESMHRRWDENREELMEKIREANMGNDYAKGNTLSEEHKRAISEFHTGKIRSDECRRLIAEGQMGNNNGGRVIQTVEETDHEVDSYWEAEFDRRLHNSGVSYEYEGRTFDIGDGRGYTPDFIIGDIVVELKGAVWTGWSIERAERFRQHHPEFTYVVVGNEDIPCDIHYSWEDREAAITMVKMHTNAESFTTHLYERVV